MALTLLDILKHASVCISYDDSVVFRNVLTLTKLLATLCRQLLHFWNCLFPPFMYILLLRCPSDQMTPECGLL